MMKLIRILTILVFLAIPGGMFGCGGGGAQVQQQTTTLGQELKDLDDAYKKGLLDEKEYQKVRKELIKKHTD
jgi:hypothetical protein